MKNIALKQSVIRLIMLAVLGFTAFGFTAEMGLDRYEIYLNNKPILEQAVNAPVNLRTLQLSNASNNDILRIVYIHCTNKGVGTDRSITVKNDKGELLKKWTFKDDKAMEIPVKELLSLEKQHADRSLSLHYGAHELYQEDMLLAAVRFK